MRSSQMAMHSRQVTLRANGQRKEAKGKNKTAHEGRAVGGSERYRSKRIGWVGRMLNQTRQLGILVNGMLCWTRTVNALCREPRTTEWRVESGRYSRGNRAQEALAESVNGAPEERPNQLDGAVLWW